MTKQSPDMKPPTHKQKKEVQQRDRSGTIGIKTVRGLKPVLFARNLTFNSDVTLFYKIYVSSAQRSTTTSVTYHTETNIIANSMKKGKSDMI